MGFEANHRFVGDRVAQELREGCVLGGVVVRGTGGVGGDEVELPRLDICARKGLPHRGQRAFTLRMRLRQMMRVG